MSVLLDLGKKLTEYQNIKTAVAQGLSPVSVYGVSSVHKAHLAAMLLSDLPCPFLYIVKDEEYAKKICADISELSGTEPVFLPGRDFVFYNVENVSKEYEQKSTKALWDILSSERPVVVTTPETLMSFCIPPHILKKSAFSIKTGQEYSIQELVDILIGTGYKRFEAVEGPGQVAQRGDILDVFPVSAQNPVRIEFFGDTVDTINYFDIASQRRTERLDEFEIIPVSQKIFKKDDLVKEIKNLAASSENEKLTAKLKAMAESIENDIYSGNDTILPLIYDKLYTPLDYISNDSIVIIDDTPAVSDNAKGFEFRMSESVSDMLAQGELAPGKCDFAISHQLFKERIAAHKTLLFDTFLSGSMFSPREIISVQAKQLPAYGGSFDAAVSDIESYMARDYITLVFAGGDRKAANMSLLLEERGVPISKLDGVPEQGSVYVLPSSVSSGIEYPSIKLAVISEGQIAKTGRAKKAESQPKTNKNRIQSFTDLNIGDLVVHEHHGIGRFTAMEKISHDGVERDYMKISFAGTDNLYVPATSLGLISKYIGAGENSNVRLSKLGGAGWEKARSRAKKSAKDLAQYLIGIYAKRKNTKGFAFEPDSDWQKAFEESFEYEETPDQLTAAEEIKRDMENPYPMDRLLCGDVGFGKTEVAFRAIMKCILSGKQAAILVPTTVLARQHYFTARNRFASYPVAIDTLSRFRSTKQQKEICMKLKTGEIDLVIGTHRMLQKDVKFKDLGLLVVDEEQRFGVSHKEKIKEMSAGVDVLTLSATPIPRTLNMALSGIRDMSILEEAPRDRLPVQTYVLEHNDNVIFDAISKELSRNGQVYYLHNHIESIDSVCSKLRKRFPDAVVEGAHGKMDESTLSDIMNRLYSGEIQILVCTTIIETGIDVANVNTIIIENADMMGLAQLHQIRGRVGRSHRHAYAYLTYHRGKVLSEVSQKRLSAMKEFAEFGAGFKIAMRDLEIRGAGNLLGGEQSGHMMSVGYDMYLKLLEEAVNELSGNGAPPRTETHIDIETNALLPDFYVKDPGQRIDLYRRIGQVQTTEEYQDILDEIIDRFGEPPPQAVSLLRVALLRANASENGISEITQKKDNLIIHFAVSDIERAVTVAGDDKFKKRILFNATSIPYVTIHILKGEDSLVLAEEFVKKYSEIPRRTQ